MRFYTELLDKLTEGITRPRLRKFLEKYSTNSQEVLDLGSSTRPYTDLFPKAISLDIQSKSSVHVIADAHFLPFKSNQFEMIVCTEVLEHLYAPHLAIKEMNRVLKKGGKLILTTRFLFPIHDSPKDFFRFTKHGLIKLFSEWKIIELVPESDNLETMGVLFQRLGFQANTNPSFLRFAFFIISIILIRINSLVKSTFGDITRNTKDTPAFSSGYYISCQKLKSA